jgi:hypothetical protein
MKMFIVRWLAGGIMRDVAEGRKGARAQAAYLWLAGKKTYTGLILGLLLGAVNFFAPEAASRINEPAGLITGLLVGWGLLDKTWRNTTPPEWAGEGLKLLVSLGPAASGLVALVAQLRPDLAPTVDAWAAATAAATAWLGTRLNDPPALPQGK